MNTPAPMPSARPATRSSFSTRFWLAQAAVALSLHSAQAGTFTWDGGSTADSNWSTPENWAGDVTPSNPVLPTAPDIITLKGSTRLTPAVDAPWAIDRLQFDGLADSFHLSGQTITFQPTGTIPPTGTLGHDGRFFLINSSGKTQTIDNNLVLTPALPGPGISTLGAGINVGSGAFILNGNLDLGSTSGLRLTGSGTITVNGVISGTPTGTTAINSGATVIFNTTNTFTNSFTIWHGAAKLTVDAPSGANGPLGNSTSQVVMGHSGSLGAKLLASAAITVGRGADMVRNSTNKPYTIGGDTAHVSNFTGAFNNGASGADSNSVIVTAAAGGRANITGITRRSNATAASTLQDTLTKDGAGIVALTGTSDYSGQTNVNAGTLLVNGMLSLSAANSTSVGDVVVAPGATLGGTGFIYRNTVIQDGGILSPGDTGASEGGLLTIGVGVAFSNASILRFDLGAPDAFTNDEVSIDGNLTLDGILDVTALNGFGVGSYKLFDYSNTFLNNGVAFGNMPAGFDYSLSVDSATSAVYLNVVPEPATGAFLGIAGALALVRRRRA